MNTFSLAVFSTLLATGCAAASDPPAPVGTSSSALLSGNGLDDVVVEGDLLDGTLHLDASCPDGTAAIDCECESMAMGTTSPIMHGIPINGGNWGITCAWSTTSETPMHVRAMVACSTFSGAPSAPPNLNRGVERIAR